MMSLPLFSPFDRYRGLERGPQRQTISLQEPENGSPPPGQKKNPSTRQQYLRYLSIRKIHPSFYCCINKPGMMGLPSMCQYGASKMATYHLNAAASRLGRPTGKGVNLERGSRMIVDCFFFHA
ncbi:hypothetical protein QC762_705240 [Podospora pseudocomata]|uniref:Uncharacterized protein n=1 Tax=Podospora pseudocomata TaxID=2093779 RepID=A0ABR0G3B8_9PEZI|nr:hypothetical protein QC762_705240 [Podospora pseudocomata]